jgi:DNA polymerase III epsilon subunit-like protein
MEPYGLVYVDVETTGLRTDYDRIVSISGLMCDSPRNRVFNELVNPGVQIPDGAKRIHGISDDDVSKCDSFKAVGERFFQWVFDNAGPDPVLAAYNGHNYDFEIMWHEARRWKCALPPFTRMRGYDPLRAARVVLRQLPSKRQADVYNHLFGAPPEKQHTSLGDVEAMQRIVRHDVFAHTIEEHTKKLNFTTSSAPCDAPARTQSTRG